MPDFIRARSEEQKQQRMQEIKTAADALFTSQPYQTITLTTIAEQLQCSRAQLYKYVTTKEEIFLELSADKREAYFAALKAAFPAGCEYSNEVFAEVWAGILNGHKSYLRYCDILMTIIETNVTVERLAVFKKNYYESADAVIAQLSESLHLSPDRAEALFYDVYYHAVGINSACYNNPLVREAMALIGREAAPPDFLRNLKEFILMCLTHYRPSRDK